MSNYEHFGNYLYHVVTYVIPVPEKYGAPPERVLCLREWICTIYFSFL